MKLRVLAAGLLVVAGLAGCQTKVGQAAVVGGHQIAESEVGKYVTKSGPTSAVKAAAKQQGQQLPAVRAEAVSTLVQAELFTQALDRNGSVPTQAQLDQLHDETAQRFFQSSVAGDQFDAQLIKQAKQYGFTEAFAHLVIREAELEDAFADRIKASSITDVINSVTKLHIPISVIGRYGKWDPKTLQLSTSTTSGLPSFVTFGSGATGDSGQ